GEKTTSAQFIVACNNIIYIEIMKGRSKAEVLGVPADNNKKDETDKITPRILKLLTTTIDDLGDDEGWAFLGDVGNLLQKKQPNFDARNYGFSKLTPLVRSIERFEIEERESYKGSNKLIFVRNKK